jgi:hypothetical protein
MLATLSLTLPRPDQVATRALGLSALLCRASMEDPSARDDATAMHALVRRWLYDVGAEKGLESDELEIVDKAPGTLTREEAARAAWCQEELSVLAWALGRAPLPRSHERHKPRWLARRVGFLAEDAQTLIRSATLRPAGELLQYAVIIEEVHRTVVDSWQEEQSSDLAMAVCVAAERREAAAWLVGERHKALEPRADA